MWHGEALRKMLIDAVTKFTLLVVLVEVACVPLNVSWANPFTHPIPTQAALLKGLPCLAVYFEHAPALLAHVLARRLPTAGHACQVVGGLMIVFIRLLQLDSYRIDPRVDLALRQAGAASAPPHLWQLPHHPAPPGD